MRTSATTTSATTAPTLVGPADAIAVVPHLLGFLPTGSLIAIWIANGAVALTQRIDLDGDCDPRDAAAQLVATATHSRPDALIVIVADPGDLDPGAPAAASEGQADDPALPHVELVEALTDRAVQAGIEVLDALLTIGDRYWSYRCSGGCCPSSGRQVGAVARRRMAEAFGGAAPCVGRSDLVEAFAADPAAVGTVEPCIEELEHDLDRDVADAVATASRVTLERWRDARIALLEADLASPDADHPSPRTIARLLTGLADTRVRDTLVWSLARSDRRAPVVGALTEALRAAPPGYIAPIATVLALCLWQAGDGARAAMALDRARADDEHYALADLVHRSMSAGLPPSAWTDVILAMPRERCRVPDGLDVRPEGASV